MANATMSVVLLLGLILLNTVLVSYSESEDELKAESCKKRLGRKTILLQSCYNSVVHEYRIYTS